jgi:hypothetical protein
MTGMPTPYCEPSEFSVRMWTGLAGGAVVFGAALEGGAEVPPAVCVTVLVDVPDPDEHALRTSARTAKKAAATHVGRARSARSETGGTPLR